ncbi:hypothetical protein L228DRAFT_21005 [Xylona heveae TC161]|uniref:Uncharacterized protein n=1 Tax=Xylona heveae (strain CBS 132557 / TC161) TaxID=1328760 RepID=A0A165K1Q7_XYLHT|nr:hypothetical protein L228DRAFT_21005 [Xylona heveae TC161]KZF26889.1 hypothetical protein L228DRAFT_21005 [Xylona heveae TC161]
MSSFRGVKNSRVSRICRFPSGRAGRFREAFCRLSARTALRLNLDLKWMLSLDPTKHNNIAQSSHLPPSRDSKNVTNRFLVIMLVLILSYIRLSQFITKKRKKTPCHPLKIDSVKKTTRWVIDGVQD